MSTSIAELEADLAGGLSLLNDKQLLARLPDKGKRIEVSIESIRKKIAALSLAESPPPQKVQESNIIIREGQTRPKTSEVVGESVAKCNLKSDASKKVTINEKSGPTSEEIKEAEAILQKWGITRGNVDENSAPMLVQIQSIRQSGEIKTADTLTKALNVLCAQALPKGSTADQQGFIERSVMKVPTPSIASSGTGRIVNCLSTNETIQILKQQTAREQEDHRQELLSISKHAHSCTEATSNPRKSYKELFGK